VFNTDRYQQTAQLYEKDLKVTLSRNMTSANNYDSDMEFILRGRSFIFN
jgi:hypothetical protein